MIFQRIVKYDTNLEIEEINTRLSSVTEKFHTNTNDKISFEGKIEMNRFRILPTFNYESNEKLRPEIIGTSTRKESKTEITLQFQLPSELKTLFIFTLILNLGIMTLMISLPNLTKLPFWDKWWIILIFLPITFLVFRGSFLSKVDKSERILKNLLKLR